MENNKIEINGKVLELPRSKKRFERYITYWNYLEGIVKEAFPVDSIKSYTSSIEDEFDYEEFVGLCVRKLSRAVEEKEKETKKFDIRILFKKKDKVEDIEKEQEDKKSLLSVVVTPFKTIGNGIKKGFSKITSLLPWSKNKKIDLDSALEQDEIFNTQNIDLDEELKRDEEIKEDAIIKEVQEELKKNVNEQLEKNELEALREENERLRAENIELNNRLEEVKVTEPKVSYTDESEIVNVLSRKTLEDKINRLVDSINNDINFKYDSVNVYDPYALSNPISVKLPYEVNELYKETNELGIVDSINYRRSLVLSETEDTVTITEQELNNLLEFERANLESFRYLGKKYLDSKNNKINVDASRGFVSKNTKTDLDNNIIEESYTITKERYEELLKAAEGYLVFAEIIGDYCSEFEEEKKLVKRA